MQGKYLDKGSYFTAVSIGAATVWFSTHCGAGFASGTQETIYFVSAGYLAPFLTAISQIMMGFVMWVALESARLYNCYGYRELSDHIFHPYQKVLSFMYELMAPISATMACGACMAGGAAVLNQNLGVPTFVGTIIMLVGIILITMFGANVVRTAGTAMTIAIIGIIILVTVLATTQNWDQIAYHFTHRIMYVSPGKAIWNAFLYGFFNMALWGVAAAAAVGIKHRNEAKGMAISGAALNIVMLSSVTLMLLGVSPTIMTDPQASLLPTLYAVKGLNQSIIGIVYPLLLFLAYITTAVGNAFMIQTRFGPVFFKKMSSTVKKNAIITICFLVIAWAVSQVGLIAIINKGYRFNGYVFIFTVFIPFLTIGLKNIKLYRKKEENGELPHLIDNLVDEDPKLKKQKG
ncbi:MAG: hypothetical protein LKJ83_09805 [Eubacteriaceae bacterium]|jgi:uncharacterized membrane protein YkvI|nr:hypothetical protein [Eubacteriaceae bacterium]